MNNDKKYVSRAGYKLELAIKEFQISPEGKICADFGCSTGGFTDCLLQFGAEKVYAIDTAYGELDWKFRSHPKVIVMERTNVLDLNIEEKVDLVTIDVGWTRQSVVLPYAINILKKTGIIISLIKPHYEADKKLLKNGVLNESQAEAILFDTLDNLLNKFKETLVLEGKVKSPIEGKKGGNTEYLVGFTLRQ